MIFHEKLAEKKQSRDEAQRERGKAILGAMGIAGGGAAIRGSAPLVTGRRTVYHGTTKDIAQKIRESGLAPALVRDAEGNITVRGGNVMEAAAPHNIYGQPLAYYGNFDTAAQRDRFFDSVDRLRNASDPDEIERIKAEFPEARGGRGSVYLDGNKRRARFYANQQALIREEGVSDVPSLQVVQRRAANPFFRHDGADVVRARIPYSLERKMIENPEIAYHQNVLQDPAHVFSPDAKRQREAQIRQLRESYVLPGGLGPEYIVGSDDFKAHSLDEFKDYVSNNKGRFAKGVGLAGVGALAAGVGARSLYQQYKRRQEKRAGLSYDREKLERDTRGGVGGFGGLVLGTGAGLYGSSKLTAPMARHGAAAAGPILGMLAGKAIGKALPASGKYSVQDALVAEELKKNPDFRKAMIEEYGLKGYK